MPRSRCLQGQPAAQERTQPTAQHPAASPLPANSSRKRRNHTKSRNGCVRCKRLRRKCDERLPRCTRCTDLDQVCQYPNDDYRSEQKLSPGSRAQRVGLAPPDDHHGSFAGVSPMSGTASRELSPVPSPPSAAFALDGHQHGIMSLCTHLLDARDLQLLSHYLSHTSRIIAFDRDDLYVLHVGIPNLAFSSKALMSSMLALAAASQCHDLLEATPGSPDVARIRELLVLAEQHHAASLRQIQEDIPSTERYDHVLANAALMVLYGSASHWVRIRLMRVCCGESGGGGNRLPEEFVPVRSQWMSLIRAVHSAYVGLLADQAQNPAAAVLGDSEGTSMPRIDFGNVDLVCPEDGPSDETRRLFLPILAATSGAALTKLRARARQVETDATIGNESLGVCMEALAVFQKVLGETFRDRRHGGLSPGSQTDDPRGPLHPPSLGRLSNVAPWLRRYTARVTMNSTDSRPLRRTVNAFINRVPTKYLHMVQATLEQIPVEATGRGATRSQGCTLEDQDADNGPVQRLAMDIFAHWLVLLLLLDGVWWIGGVGAWELGRVVVYARERGWVDKGDQGGGEAWWPQSMYNIRMELSKNLAR